MNKKFHISSDFISLVYTDPVGEILKEIWFGELFIGRQIIKTQFHKQISCNLRKRLVW